MRLLSWRGLLGATAATVVAFAALSPVGPAAAQSLENVPRSETLILARTPSNTIADYNQMNPYGLGGLGRIRDTLNKTIYEFLFYYNHNTGEIIPWLATGYTYNDDFTEITIKLREGVEWSDGQPFTADDIKFTMDMIKSNNTLVFSSDMNEWVKEVVVEDPLTAKIVLNKPNPRWAYFYLAENSEINMAILPKHIWEGQDAAGFSNFDIEKGWPVGTGPFRLVKATDQQLVFERRDDWWAKKIGFHELPKMKRFVRIPGGDQSSQTRLFASGQIDFGGAILAGDFAAAKARNPDLVSWNKEGPVWGTADACSYTLGVNNKVAPFDKPEVRRALDFAIDRDKLITLALENSTVPMVLPLSSFGGVMKYSDKVQDLIDASGLGKPNPDKVVELMTSAGFKKDGDGFWVGPDGKRIEMTIATTGGRRPLGPPVAQMLHDAGFDAIARHDETAQITNAIRDGTQTVWIDPHCGASQEPFPTFSHFMSKYSAPIGKTTGYRWANSRYENPEYDAILQKMEAMSPSPDDPEYIKLFRQAVEIWLRDLPEIVLTEERWVWTYNAHCWKGWPSAEDPYIAPYDVWGAFMLAVLKLEPTGKCG